MGLDYIPRWGHYRKASTRREKDDWMLAFVRAEATAPPPRPKPAEWLQPPPAMPEAPALKDPVEVFATLRAKMGNL